MQSSRIAREREKSLMYLCKYIGRKSIMRLMKFSLTRRLRGSFRRNTSRIVVFLEK